MAFTSKAVTVEWKNNNLIFKRGTSTLVINPEHVMELRSQDDLVKFTDFFRQKALQNREARRLFDAWERKDSELLNKIYAEVTSGT